jgi:hypothetical protein
MTQLTTYAIIGKKESVHDSITNITPSACPFQTLVKSEKVTQRNFDWLEDAGRASAATAYLEGAESTFTAMGQPTLRSNVTQIIGEAFTVSNTSEVVETHGRKRSTAYNLAKVLVALKKDVEKSMVGVSQAAVNSGANAARKMASINQMISTTVDAGSNSTDPLTEAKLLTLAQTCYTNGSDPTVLMIKPADSLIIAGFASATGRERDIGASKTLVNTIDVLVTAFGTFKVVLNRENLATNAYLIDPSMFKQCVLRPFSRTLLATTGDNSKHLVIGEVSVKHNSFADSGMITGLS